MTTVSKQGGLKVLVCDPVDNILIQGLTENGYEVAAKPEITSEALLVEIADYDAVVVRSRTKLFSDVLSHAKNLKVIARAGVGTDNIDIEMAASRGIRVVTAAGSSTESVAELNVALMVDLARGISRLNRNVREGTYRKERGSEVHGKTAGIVGFGRIGFETSKILKAMNMDILAYDIYENQGLMNEIGGSFVSLQELLKRSDYVFVLITLSGKEGYLLGKDELAVIKDGARIINTSRAEAVDPDALFSAMESSRIQGYASDVLWHEPPSTDLENKLVAMDNTVITPHIGAQTTEAQKRVASVTLENLLKALESVA